MPKNITLDENITFDGIPHEGHKHAMDFGHKHAMDFKIRSQTYLVACSARMLSDEESLTKVKEHAEFIKEDSEKSNLRLVRIRLYTEKDSSTNGISLVKGSLRDLIDNVHIEHIKDVSPDEMLEILDFCNNRDLGYNVDFETIEQSKEQKEKEVSEQ